MAKFEGLEKALCKELEILDQKLRGGTEMSTQDLEKIDKITHSLKSIMLYEEKMEELEIDDEMGMSGRQRRGSDGRYMSGRSYANGYSRGYSEAMSQARGRSGHYPMYPYQQGYDW